MTAHIDADVTTYDDLAHNERWYTCVRCGRSRCEVVRCDTPRTDGTCDAIQDQSH